MKGSEIGLRRRLHGAPWALFLGDDAALARGSTRCGDRGIIEQIALCQRRAPPSSYASTYAEGYDVASAPELYCIPQDPPETTASGTGSSSGRQWKRQRQRFGQRQRRLLKLRVEPSALDDPQPSR